MVYLESVSFFFSSTFLGVDDKDDEEFDDEVEDWFAEEEDEKRSVMNRS